MKQNLISKLEAVAEESEEVKLGKPTRDAAKNKENLNTLLSSLKVETKPVRERKTFARNDNYNKQQNGYLDDSFNI